MRRHTQKTPSRIKQKLKKNQVTVEEEIEIVEEEMGKETICRRLVSYRRCIIEVIAKDY